MNDLNIPPLEVEDLQKAKENNPVLNSTEAPQGEPLLVKTQTQTNPGLIQLQNLTPPPRLKKAVSVEGIVCLFVIVACLAAFGIVMGFSNAINSIFNTAFNLLTETVWYLLAIIVIMGALAEILSEFGVISIANKLFAPLMKPLFGMPGATSMAILSSFLSDNPSVLTLSENNSYRRYFKKYQLATLTNIGTTYGMGLIVLVTMMSFKSNSGQSFVWPVLIGFLAVFITSIFVSRMMLSVTKKRYGVTASAVVGESADIGSDIERFREVRQGNFLNRMISALLDGGQRGVKLALGIIPGVLIIATLVLMLSNGKPIDGYTGGVNEGIGLIPLIGDWMAPVIKFLFGFESSASIAVPLTALGSAGAALGVIEKGITAGMLILTPNNVAVFTAMCMFWSGYLSTHVSMMDSLNMREMTGWAILFHTIGGIVAGILANGMVSLINLLL